MKEQLLDPNAACANCGRLFFCGKNLDDCWCDGLTLSDQQRAALTRARLEGCLCVDCLEAL
jgi:hypothetical protein